MITRPEIFSLLREYHKQQPTTDFVPGVTPIPPTGKVVDDGDLVAIVDAALDLWLTAGRFCGELEAGLARFLEVPRCLLVNSGSSANLLAVSALGSAQLGARRLAQGSEVITVAAGFPSTVAPIIQSGFVPVFVDILQNTYNADPALIEAAVGPRTRAIVLAHTMGNPFELDAIVEIARRHELFLVEDTCDALGSLYGNRKAGSFGDFATASFYPAHHMTTGEGGAVFSADSGLRRIVESLRDWGRDCWCPTGKDNTCRKRFGWKLGSLPAGYDHKYIYTHLGYNLKMTEMQGALGCSQLAKLPGFIARRRQNFAILHRLLLEAGLDRFFHLPQATPRSEPSWFGFPLTLRDDCGLQRSEVVNHLEKHLIGTRPLFAGNLVRQPAFEGVPHRVSGELTTTDKVMRDGFWLGIRPGLEIPHLEYMARVLSALAGGSLNSR